MVRKKLTPKVLFEAYKAVDSDKNAVKKIITLIIDDLTETLKLEPEATNHRVWQIVEDQKAVFLSFSILCKDFYRQDIIPSKSHSMLLKMYAPEIHHVWLMKSN